MLRRRGRGLARRGRCRPGDKTILDTLAPAADGLRGARSNAATAPAPRGGRGRGRGAPGMRSTRDLVARRGLAMRLGDRSVGHLDPGAVSCLLLLRAAGRPVNESSATPPRERIATLERESRRAFEDAQREADALFAQYQLSQLIASGGTLAEPRPVRVLEAVRLAGVDRGALWLGRADGAGLDLLAAVGTTRPRSRGPAADARRPRRRPAWASSVPARGPSCSPTTRRPILLVRSGPTEGRALDEDGVRVAQLARHELAVAFRGARLREALERSAASWPPSSTARPTSSSRSMRDGRVVRLNPAGERLLGIAAADGARPDRATTSSAARSRAGTAPAPVRWPR